MEEEKHTPEKETKEEIHSHQEGKLTKKIRENPWILSTFVLGVLGLILLIGNFGGITGATITGAVVDEGVAKDAVLNFVKSQGADAEVVGVEEDGNFYVVTILFQGQEIPLHVTKDGEFLAQLTPLSMVQQQDSQQQESVDWSVFENELPSDMKSKILSFTIEQSKEYDASMRINEFANYDLIPKTLISFYGASCGWCTKYHPVLVEAMEKYPEITIYALDLSENREVAEKYGATGTPANIINGKYFVSGYRPIEDLSEILDKLN